MNDARMGGKSVTWEVSNLGVVGGKGYQRSRIRGWRWYIATKTKSELQIPQKKKAVEGRGEVWETHFRMQFVGERGQEGNTNKFSNN